MLIQLVAKAGLDFVTGGLRQLEVVRLCANHGAVACSSIYATLLANVIDLAGLLLLIGRFLEGRK